MSTYSAQTPILSTEERARLQSAIGDAILLTPHTRSQKWATRIMEVGALFAVSDSNSNGVTFSAFEIIAAALREPMLREVIANCLQLVELEQRPLAVHNDDTPLDGIEGP